MFVMWAQMDCYLFTHAALKKYVGCLPSVSSFSLFYNISVSVLHLLVLYLRAIINANANYLSDQYPIPIGYYVLSNCVNKNMFFEGVMEFNSHQG